MAKTSLSSKEFNRIQANIVKELVGFQWQHEAGENNRLRISRGNTLNRISRIVEKVAEVGDARQILALERHCEQSYLAFLPILPIDDKAAYAHCRPFLASEIR